MSNANEPLAIEAAENLSEKSVQLASEASAWISGNAVDVLIATAIGIGIALIMLGIRSAGSRLVIRSGTAAPHWRIIFARVIAKTSLFFIVTCSALLVSEYAETPPIVFRVIHFLFVIAAAFQAAVWVRELVLGFVEHRVGYADEHSTLGSAVGIIRLLVTVALFAIALILILDNLGVDVTGLVAGLGIGGIAIGLAAQGIFSDLFAALAIIFDKPFRRGDGVRVDQINGSVEQIGLKTTRIRSLSGEEVSISNAKLLDMQLHNFSRLEHRRFVLLFGLVYQTQPEVCASVPDRIGTIVAQHPHAAMVRCGMIGFGASSLDFELQFDVHSTDYDVAFSTRSAVCLDILRTFNKAGIRFAYPTQTSFTAAPDGTFVEPYPHVRMIATEELDP